MSCPPPTLNPRPGRGARFRLTGGWALTGFSARKGTVRKVDRKRNRVTVEGRNLVKKTVKKTAESPGGIVSKEAPLSYSNVMLADPVTGAPVRSTYRFLEDGSKVRVTVGKGASGSVVPRPEILRERRKPLPAVGGPKDTPPDVVQKQTFQGFAAGGLGGGV